MSQQKNSFITLRMSSRPAQLEDTGIVYYSADFLTALQQFKLIDDDTNESIKLDELRYAQLTLAPDFNWSCIREKVTLELELIDKEQGLFKVILPVRKLWLDTIIRGEVVAFYESDDVSPSLHIGQFLMKFNQSMIDMDAEERETHWVSTFAETHDKLIAVLEDAIAEVENMEVIQGPPGTDGQNGLSAFEVAVQNGFEGTESEWLESLRGETGKQGETGATGDTGAIGERGQDGTNGMDGANGLSAFEIAIQNGFTGTEAQWLESLRGADGTNGVDGTPGATGERGEDGKPGTDGLSAFEIAVQNGFAGTEDEWLESLRGQDGEPPENMLWNDILGRPSDFTNLSMLTELDPHTFRMVNTPVTQHEAHNNVWVRTGDTANWWAQLMLTEFRMEPAVGDVFNISFSAFREGNWTANTRLLMRYIYTDNTSSEALNWGTVPIGLTPTDVNVDVTIAHAPDPARTLSHVNVFLQRDNNGNGFINVRQVRITRRMRSQELLWEHGTLVVNLPNNFVTDASVPITVYPDGRSVHFLSANPATSGFPFGTAMVENNRFGTNGIRVITNLMSGAVQKQLWSGISWQSWMTFDSIELVKKLCEKLGVNFEELMEELESE